MKISTPEVAHVADLARLELSQDALSKYAGQLAGVLDYVDKLNEVDTTGVAPTSHAIAMTNAFREDRVGEHMDRDLVLANAPQSEDGAFVVPKVID